MRLSEFEKEAIIKTFLEVFKEGEIYLFGSRVNNNLKGGDIDLYINSSAIKKEKIEFLVKLKKRIGERKIDVVLNKEGLIKKNALKGILLWKS